jgi:hypothetical protein
MGGSHEFQADDLELRGGAGGGGFLLCGADHKKSRHAETTHAGIWSDSVMCDFSGDGDSGDAHEEEEALNHF